MDGVEPRTVGDRRDLRIWGRRVQEDLHKELQSYGAVPQHFRNIVPTFALVVSQFFPRVRRVLLSYETLEHMHGWMVKDRNTGVPRA